MNRYNKTWEERIKTKVGYKVVGLLILIGIVTWCINLSTSPDILPTNKQPVCADCHSRKKAMVEYFKKSKNPNPEAMAEAVLKTRSPRLLAAIAVKGEKNTPYTVRRGGFKGRHSGAFQVNGKLHGRVPHDPIGQALQTERILNELVAEERNIIKVLNSYGGESNKLKGKYAYNVIAELERVP